MESTRQVTNSSSHQLILFDGVCNLCNGFVQFVIARDPAGRFRFATLQSETARRLLEQHPMRQPAPDSVFLIENGEVFTRSAAALRVARGLTFPWFLAAPLLAVPRPLRDWVYDLVARNRYRWFGQKTQCMVPTPALRSRFLE